MSDHIRVPHDIWTSIEQAGVHVMHTAGDNVVVRTELGGTVTLPNLPRGQWKVRRAP